MNVAYSRFVALRKLRRLEVVRRIQRYRFARSYFAPRLSDARSWAIKRTESDNFYYELTQKNELELAGLLSVVLGQPMSRIVSYFDEIRSNEQLRQHIEAFLRRDPSLRDAKVGFGRRIGWYACVRAMKPDLVVETGVHHGVGALVIIAALMRNREEGSNGRYLGTDIDPNAGVLISGAFAGWGDVAIADSQETLSSLEDVVDVFINDSDHSAEYEAAEYAVIAPKLASQSLVLGDNSHVTSALAEFAKSHSRPYVFFREQPDQHWYPGAGIGISPSQVPLLSDLT